MLPDLRPSRRALLQMGGAGLAASALAACGSSGSSSGSGAQMQFMYWGSAFEKAGIDKMLKQFNQESQTKSTVKPMYVPYADYEAKLSSLVAAKTPPDVGYVNDAQFRDLASKNLILNLFPYLDKHPKLKENVPSSYFWMDKDKLCGIQLAMGVQILYYNKEMFQSAGVEMPPHDAANAWTFDQFVAAAEKLTIDNSGKHPTDAGFNPSQVRQFGTIAPMGAEGLYALLRSNGADISVDGKTYSLDSSEASHVFQSVQDLVYKYHVAPTPAQLGKNAPTTSVQLQTKRVAMIIDGSWAMMDLMASKVPFGVAVLPRFQKPITTTGGAPGAIFADSKHIDQALELYQFYNDPEHVDLFKSGLWMPLQLDYYKQPDKIAKWVIPGQYPDNYKEAAIDTTLNNGVTYWQQAVKNAVAIDQQYTPVLSQLSMNKISGADVGRILKPQISPLLQGLWPTQEL